MSRRSTGPASSHKLYYGDDLMLFHWSPTDRRKSIIRRGLEPGHWSADRLWRPPYVAFASTPTLAMSMSHAFKPQVPSWDLWMVWASAIDRWELLFDDRDDSVKEYRVYERIFKRDVCYVATRAA